MRKVIGVIACLLLALIALYFLRHPVLRSFATTLIQEDSLAQADVIFVLSGGGFDRGNEAAKVYHAGYAPKIVCTGGNPVKELKVFGMDTLESDMTAANLRRLGVPDSAIILIREGTSTKEEAALILEYCRHHSVKKVMIISSLIHTRRARGAIGPKLERAGVTLLMHGAPSSRFDEMWWWRTEDGLITINNEWIKQFYYWYKKLKE